MKLDLIKILRSAKSRNLVLLVVNPATVGFEPEQVILEAARELDKQLLVVYNLFDPSHAAHTAAVEHALPLLRFHRKITLAAVDAIALIESGLGGKCDVIVGVTAPVEIRIKRIMERDGLSEEYAKMRIGAQKPDSFYYDHCDHVLVSDCETVELFERKCVEFFARILEER